MSSSKAQKRINSDSHDHYQLAAKKLKTRNEIWNFADPPKCIFDSLRIPRKPEGSEPPSRLIPSSNGAVTSSIPSPLPALADNCGNADDPVTKAVLDNLTGKFNKPSGKLQHFRCKECSLFLTSQSTLDTHFAGARHARRLRELEISDVVDNLKNEKVSKVSENEFKCRLCDVSAGSRVQIKSHIDGSKHKKKMKAYQEKKNAKHKSSEKIQSISVKNLDSEIAEKISAADFTNSEKVIASNSSGGNSTAKKVATFFCNICGLSMNSQLQFDQHSNSKKHITKVSKSSTAHVNSTNSSSTIQTISVLESSK